MTIELDNDEKKLLLAGLARLRKEIAQTVFDDLIPAADEEMKDLVVRCDRLEQRLKRP